MATKEQKSDSPIVFHIGDETKPVVLNHDDYKQSLFATQIKTALKLIDEKVELYKKAHQEKEDHRFSKFNDVYDNNIISFIGER